MPLDECSVKVSSGGPQDPPQDLELPVWAGVVPLVRSWGEPIPAEDLRPGLPVPLTFAGWPAGRG